MVPITGIQKDAATGLIVLAVETEDNFSAIDLADDDGQTISAGAEIVSVGYPGILKGKPWVSYGKATGRNYFNIDRAIEVQSVTDSAAQQSGGTGVNAEGKYIGQHAYGTPGVFSIYDVRSKVKSMLDSLEKK